MCFYYLFTQIAYVIKFILYVVLENKVKINIIKVSISMLGKVNMLLISYYGTKSGLYRKVWKLSWVDEYRNKA